MKHLPLKALTLILLHTFAVLLKLLPFKIICKILPSKAYSLFPFDRHALRTYTQSISARFNWLDNCLIRCCTYYWLASLSGQPTQLHFGVRLNNTLEAHSWITDGEDNILLGDTPDILSYNKIAYAKSAIVLKPQFQG